MTYGNYQRMPILRGRTSVAPERSVDARAACDRLQARLRDLAYEEVERDANSVSARGCGLRRALVRRDAWCAERIEIGAVDTPDGVELHWRFEPRASLTFARFVPAVAVLSGGAYLGPWAVVAAIAVAGSVLLDVAWIYGTFPAFLRRIGTISCLSSRS